MATFPLTGLTVEVRRTADDQYYQFGVDVDGVFVSFGARKTGGVDDDLARAAEDAKTKAAAAPVPAPRPSLPPDPSPVADPAATPDPSPVADPTPTPPPTQV